MKNLSVVIPNLNGSKDLAACLDSLQNQSLKARIIVVDNASTDVSVGLIESKYPDIEIIVNDRNYGFAGGVNRGIKLALDRGDKYIALLNNDAVADSNWLNNLKVVLDENPEVGIVTSKIISIDRKFLDSTGDFYTTWGLPFPRGRNETKLDKYDQVRQIFAASGGASLYRARLFNDIGLFDEDFFAYYEDVDISFRARLRGWDILFEPTAIAYHHINATSNRMPGGFATQQTLRNLPFLLIKNVPFSLLPRVLPRFAIIYTSIFLSSYTRGSAIPALKGLGQSLILVPKKIIQRFKIQHSRKITVEQLWELLVHDLPPDARKLRAVRNIFRRLTFRKAI